MTPRPRYLARLAPAAAILAAAAALSLPAGCTDSGTGAPQPETGSPSSELARDFTLKDLDGNSVTLSSFRGKSNVLIHFGTTWCGPCLAQVPTLKQLAAKYRADQLTVLAVDSGEAPDVVKRFAEREGARYTTLLDTDGAVGNAYGVQFIPLNILVDTTGHIVGAPSNPIPVDAIEMLISAQAAVGGLKAAGSCV